MGWLERLQQRAAKRPVKRRHWGLRNDVSFDEANDHNPLVLDECPRCGGRGQHDEWDRDEAGHVVQSLVQCAQCGGGGTTGERVRYFDNDRPVVEVVLSSGRWITCPCCGWSFSITDRRVWTGLRHVRCGQRIRPIEGKAG